MNPYDAEYEVQRRRDVANALSRRGYQKMQEDAAVTQQRRAQRQRLGTALAALFQRLRRRKREQPRAARETDHLMEA